MEHWLELALETDAETAEAIHEALFPIVEGKLALEQINHYAEGTVERWEEEAAQGPVIARAWLPIDDTTEARRQRVEHALAALRLIVPSLPAARWREVQASDWANAWRESFKPLRIGDRLLVHPSWIDAASAGAQDGDILIALDPGMAFGTGLHPTTQLCARAMQAHIRPGMRVLDVGCGSGILSILAVKLGAAEVLGVDTDPEAVRVSAENAELNLVADRARFLLGSFEQAQGCYDWVVANILAKVIIALLQQGLADCGDNFVFSGILEAQADEVREACTQAGLCVVAQEVMGDWVALIAQRPKQSL